MTIPSRRVRIEFVTDDRIVRKTPRLAGSVGVLLFVWVTGKCVKIPLLMALRRNDAGKNHVCKV